MKLQVFLYLSVPLAVNCFSFGNFVGTGRTSSSLIRPSSSFSLNKVTRTKSRHAINFTALFEQSKETEPTKSEAKTDTEFQKVITNISSGELGSRGEIYFAIQAVLFLCILYGNIPVLGDVLTFLFGPVACLAGVAVAALGLKDLVSFSKSTREYRISSNWNICRDSPSHLCGTFVLLFGIIHLDWLSYAYAFDWCFVAAIGEKE